MPHPTAIYLPLLALSIGLTAACSKPATSKPAEAWNEVNDPLTLSDQYEYTWSALPLSGHLKTAPWVDSYWPSSQGGLAYRWNSDKADGFTYSKLTKAKVAKLSNDELAALSPAEKFDIYRGRYDFPLVDSERARTSPDQPSWEGLCHGWAPASLAFNAPEPVTMANDDGIEVSFAASDLKALLLYVQGEVSTQPARTLGERCEVNKKSRKKFASSEACSDTNAAAFHIALSNQLGLMHKGFVADVTRDDEVWNHPVFGFDSKVVKEQGPSAGAAPGTVREIEIETVMNYAVEIDPKWESAALASDTKNYRYRLELDANNVIIGGEWLTFDRPDFLWTQDRAELTGEYALLQTLYNAATQK